MPRARLLLFLTVPVAVGLAVGLSGTVGARGARSRDRSYTAKETYTQTNGGHQQGSSLVGVEGRGTFRAHLSGSAAVDVAIIAMAIS